MRMTMHLLAAFGAVGFAAASGIAFAGDPSAKPPGDNGAAPPPTQANGSGSKDAKLEKKLEAKLAEERALVGDQVDVTVSQGNVLLTGTVDRDADKERAAGLVSGVKGVNAVDNQIQVSMSDAAMAPGSSEQEMREQTSPPTQAAPAPGPRPLPLPSEPAAPGRRSADNPGTERLPTSPEYRNGDVTPGTNGTSPSSPLR